MATANRAGENENRAQGEVGLVDKEESYVRENTYRRHIDSRNI
jgi:hypothetical protein